MALIFWLLMFGCLAIACLCGGRDGRIASAMILLSAIATIPIQLGISVWHQMSFLMLLNDAVLFAGFFYLAVRSDRGWPIWMAGMQFNAVLINLAAMLVPVIAGRTYFGLETIWALPILLAMAAGALLDYSYQLRSSNI